MDELNLKSTTLSPESTRLTSQYLVMEQMRGHYSLVNRAKASIDNTPPKSMQSYIGKKNQRKKKELQKNFKSWSRPCSAVEVESHQHSQDLQESPERKKTEIFKVQRNIKSPVSSQKSSVADKISWYLEALDQGVLAKTWPGKCPISTSRLVHTNSQLSLSASFGSLQREQEDLLDGHFDKFTFQTDPFKPHLLKDNHAQSRLRTMRCYSPPRRIKSIHARNNLVVAAESQDEKKLDDKQETVTEEWLHDQARRAQARQKIFWVLDHQEEDPSVDSAFNETPQGKTTISSSQIERYREEEEYMAFVRDVTEDILKKGVYSNRGIKKACQFHIQQKSKDLDKDKMQQMLDQLLSHLCISSDDSFDDVDFGFGGSSCSKNNLKWCIPLERKEKFNGDERPFFQLEEHSQLNVEESSCQSGRSKENSYVEVSDQDNSDHSLSSQTSNLGNKLTEENKDDDDTVASSPCSSGSKHVLSRTSTVNDKYSSSVCSDNYTSQLS